MAKKVIARLVPVLMLCAIVLASSVGDAHASLQVRRATTLYVKDSNTLMPIPSASVSLEGGSAGTTDSSGAHLILAEGLHHLTVAKSGYDTNQTTIDIKPGTAFTVYLKATLPPSLVYGTDFEDVTKKDATHLSMALSHVFVFGGDGGAAMWVEGVDRKTSGMACHSGSRCVGMELTDVAKSRRNEFKIYGLKSLVGDELFVSVWLYLPADWQLHGPTPQWYEIADPNTITVSPYAPYTAIHVTQQPPSSAFGVNVDYRDLNQVQHFLGSYSSFPLPRGRWFQLQYYVLRHETNGIVRVWVDGKKITDSSGIPTRNVSVDDWATIVAKIYYNSKDTYSPYRLWVDDLEIYNAKP